jgi:phosphoribosylformimino-5-aminoimidazole carboxamide ribotide isomerase
LLVIPAIDIKDGRCVRLRQGQMSRETVYSEFPEEMARRWFEQGAERLHIVDLDGAVKGRPVNKEVIRKIVHAVPAPVQLGGGIRGLETIESYLDLGIDQIILGTIGYKDSQIVRLACERFPGRIILGIDARGGNLAVEGWTEQTGISPIEMARKHDGDRLSAIIYTDIYRDGMATGPNVKATKVLAKAVQTPIIASGGISVIGDVKKLLTLAGYGVIGMITGRALYEGALDLAEAIKLAKGTKN